MTDIEYLKKYLDEDKLEDALIRLNNGEAVQYIVGNVDFYGLTFNVNKNVLIPRFETEELVSETIKYINKYFKGCVNILDIGTGSGCIAITLNKKIDCNVDAVDISTSALEVARKNNLLNNCNVNFFESDIFSNVSKKYDVLISNPPYIRCDEEIMDVVKNNEPSIALYGGDDGLYFYDKILSSVSNYLNEKSIIAFEIGALQASSITLLANKYFSGSKVIVKKDLSGLDRFIFILNGIKE